MVSSPLNPAECQTITGPSHKHYNIVYNQYVTLQHKSSHNYYVWLKCLCTCAKPLQMFRLWRRLTGRCVFVIVWCVCLCVCSGAPDTCWRRSRPRCWSCVRILRPWHICCAGAERETPARRSSCCTSGGERRSRCASLETLTAWLQVHMLLTLKLKLACHAIKHINLRMGFEMR